MERFGLNERQTQVVFWFAEFCAFDLRDRIFDPDKIVIPIHPAGHDVLHQLLIAYSLRNNSVLGESIANALKKQPEDWERSLHFTLGDRTFADPVFRDVEIQYVRSGFVETGMQRWLGSGFNRAASLGLLALLPAFRDANGAIDAVSAVIGEPSAGNEKVWMKAMAMRLLAAHLPEGGDDESSAAEICVRTLLSLMEGGNWDLDLPIILQNGSSRYQVSDFDFAISDPDGGHPILHAYEDLTSLEPIPNARDYFLQQLVRFAMPAGKPDRTGFVSEITKHNLSSLQRMWGLAETGLPDRATLELLLQVFKGEIRTHWDGAFIASDFEAGEVRETAARRTDLQELRVLRSVHDGSEASAGDTASRPEDREISASYRRRREGVSEEFFPEPDDAPDLMRHTEHMEWLDSLSDAETERPRAEDNEAVSFRSVWHMERSIETRTDSARLESLNSIELLRQEMRSECASPPLDRIDAAAFSPKRLRPHTPEIVTVAVFRKGQRKHAEKLARTSDREARLAGERTLGSVRRGSMITVTVEASGGTMDRPTAQERWHGETCLFQFVLTGSPDPAVTQAVLRIRMSIGAAEIGSMTFARPIAWKGRRDLAAGNSTRRMKRYRRVFLSYSSRNREDVAKFSSAYTKAGITCFFDRQSLHPGEEWSPRLFREIDRADLFHLFWSSDAAASVWVEKEVLRAIERRRARRLPHIAIDMLDGPPWAPHPPTLNELNFDDYHRAAMVGYARGDGAGR